jgi:hypothetical protein
MRTMARVAGAVCLIWAASAAAKATYTLRDEVPETGSNILRSTVAWPVPIDKSFAELNAEERSIVAGDYMKVGAGDEPPYPRDGMTGVLREIARLQAGEKATGWLHIAVRVDANGRARGAALLAEPNKALAQAVTYVLLNTPYKAAKCDGKPCEADYSFKYEFTRTNAHNFIVDWHHSFWMVPLRRD